MKIALLIQNNVKQVILTPETEEEKYITKLFTEEHEIKLYRGSFYTHSCQGGWYRQYQGDKSIILLLKTVTPDTQGA